MAPLCKLRRGEERTGRKMWVYIGNFLSVAIILLIAERYRENRLVRIGSFVYVWLQLSLVAALRWGIGYDYNQYYNIFYQVSRATSFAELWERWEEIGFVLFNRGMSYVTDNIIVYLFVFHGILYGLFLYYVYRYSEVKWASVLMYIALDYFAISLCFVRQSMAMVIGLFAIEMMKKRKPVLSIVLIGIAALFHSTALILLVALALSYVDFTKRKVQIGAAVFAIVAYIGCDYFLKFALVGPFGKYREYLDSPFMMKNHVFAVYFQLFLWILLLIFQKRIYEEDEKSKRLLPVICLGGFLALMTTRHYLIERVSLYITVYFIRVAAQLLSTFKKDRWNYRLAVICTLIIGAAAFAFLLRIDRYGITPYQFNQGYVRELLK